MASRRFDSEHFASGQFASGQYGTGQFASKKIHIPLNEAYNIIENKISVNKNFFRYILKMF